MRWVQPVVRLSPADCAGLALEQRHLPVVMRDHGFDPGHPAARMVFEINAPFARENVDIERRRGAFMGDQLGDIETDAPAPMIATLLPTLALPG